MKIEQGYRSRVDENGAKRIKAGERQEGLQGQIANGALKCGDGVLESAFPASGGREGKALRFLVGEGVEGDANIARSRALQEAVCQGVMQTQRFSQQHQQSQTQQASVVRWERFLPQHQLQVLLVEDDDSTRHVVSALLRNCSYEVTSAANGLLAWELMMDQTIHIDLVLTEVVMPCLSGIGLLARIMSHEAFKHIPVIMMSSYDSMNVVFKCLSKGAVDFLVKPVRKNELKNLWQHVWRRCTSSSGSRSASGSQTRKPTAPNGALDMNESGSNGESDKTSSEINVRGGSDNGSGTQSRWTKGALEVESCHQSSKLNTAGLKTGSKMLPANSTEDMSLEHEHYEEKGVDKVSAPDVAVPKVPPAESTFVINNATSKFEVPGGGPASADDAQNIIKKDAGSGPSQGNTQRAIDLMVAPYINEQDSNEEHQGDNEDEDDMLEKHASNSLTSKDKNLSDSSSPSLLDSSNLVKPSMKRLREGEDQEQGKGNRGGLIHSYTSAFSRYNTSGNFTPRTSTHTLHVGSESGMPPQESHAVPAIFTSQMDKTLLPDGGSDEMFTKSFPASSTKLEILPETSPSTKNEVPSVLPPVPSSFPSSKQPIISSTTPHTPHQGASAQVGESGEVKDCYVNYNQDAYGYSHTNDYTQYHHHFHHHHHHHHIQHHYHRVSENSPHTKPNVSQPNDQTVTDVGAGAPRSGSSNVANGADGIIGQSGSSNGYGSNGNGAVSVNGSATGSNYGSNGQSAAVVMPGGGNMEVNAQGEPDNGLPDTNGILSGHDESRFARREAVLTKFRQKRKERCFEKKVRYHSRKRLADQRPRVRGQFVKQTLYETSTGQPEQS